MEKISCETFLRITDIRTFPVLEVKVVVQKGSVHVYGFHSKLRFFVGLNA